MHAFLGYLWEWITFGRTVQKLRRLNQQLGCDVVQVVMVAYILIKCE